MSLTLIAALSLGAWLYLTLGRGRYWLADQRLSKAPPPREWPEVVAVIPARNEADSIGQVIKAHMASDYPARFSVILVDDQSTDGTADLARRAAEEDPARELQIIQSKDLPKGWSGKLWAVHQGLQQSEETFAKYVLLTDADIVLSRDTLRRLVAKAEDENLALTSLMARLDAQGAWAEFLIPAFIYFFQKLYPFPWVNDRDDNTAAAAGGVMLVRKEALDRIGGLKTFKNELIDDCALARRIKDLSSGTNIWLGLASNEAVSLREYEEMSSIWNMVARTAYAQLHHSPLMLAGTVFAMALTYVAPPLIVLTFGGHLNFVALTCALIAWALMVYTFRPTLELYGQPPWKGLLLPVAGTLYMAMTVSSARRHWRKEGCQWKGRTY